MTTTGYLRSRNAVKVLDKTGSGSAYVSSRSAHTNTRNNRHWSSSSSSSSSSTPLTFVKRRPRSTLAIIVATALVSWFTLHMYSDLFVLFQFKLRDKAYERQWITGCGLRKQPLMFVRSTDEVALVWESNCHTGFQFKWTPRQHVINNLSRPFTWSSSWHRRRHLDETSTWTPAKVTQVNVTDDTRTRFVYQVTLERLQTNTSYTYSIQLSSSPSRYIDSVPATRTKQSIELTRHTFDWLGPIEPSTESATFQMIMLSDNQFNLRMFHKVLKTLSKHLKRIGLNSLPKLILHGGDQVQNPDNLKQWQTDFFDVMTSRLGFAFGQRVPILLSRGNHDWDETGQNVYTGGSPPRKDWLQHHGVVESNHHHPGTYMSYSPHSRCRIIVLDSNLSEMDQIEQEQWLQWELLRPEWINASLKIVMVHVSPFLEFWDYEAWTLKRENEWSLFVRHKLTPLLSSHGTHLILSGHQHAYSRGFLPLSLHRSFTLVNSSLNLSKFALATSLERGWEKISNESMTIQEQGTIYVIAGGAGGTLDRDRVEQWGFYERSQTMLHHFGWIGFGFAKSGQSGAVGRVFKSGNEFNRERRIYKVGMNRICQLGQHEVTDVLEWQAVSVDGVIFDEFRIEAKGCSF
ncbi:hypothetical protein OIO90_006298 [Microbotryomycetes sp. JL221]|nr:hypothetical protein OIO90_006298 [Microbotryomycetes sp. JL221]